MFSDVTMWFLWFPFLSVMVVDLFFITSGYTMQKNLPFFPANQFPGFSISPNDFKQCEVARCVIPAFGTKHFCFSFFAVNVKFTVLKLLRPVTTIFCIIKKCLLSYKNIESSGYFVSITVDSIGFLNY